jgi:hypothetical protein
MKIYLTIMLVFTFVLSQAQEERLLPALTVNNKGAAIQISYQQIYTEGDFNFGPRVGLIYHPLNTAWNNFYWQNIIEYKGFFISPFWLRSYDKTIGYQIPTSLGYIAKTKIANIEVWGNYVMHARTFDVQIIIVPNIKTRL